MLTVCAMWLSCGSEVSAASFRAKKTYLLVGMTGSGKSTLGNCLHNKKGDLNMIRDMPFFTSDSPAGCTKVSSLAVGAEAIIIDTVGFGDAELEERHIVRDFKEALKNVSNKIDAVLFVVKEGRFTRETVEFFQLVQTEVLKEKCVNNSILVVTQGKKGWVAKNRNNSNLNAVLANCNDQYFEFALRFDLYQDTEEDIENNIKKRAKSIHEFLFYLNNRNFKQIDLDYVHKTYINREQFLTIMDTAKPLVGDFNRFMNKTYSWMQEGMNDLKGLAELSRAFDSIRKAKTRLLEAKIAPNIVGSALGASIGAGVAGLEVDGGLLITLRHAYKDMDRFTKLTIAVGALVGGVAGWLFGAMDGLDQLDDAEKWVDDNMGYAKMVLAKRR